MNANTEIEYLNVNMDLDTWVDTQEQLVTDVGKGGRICSVQVAENTVVFAAGNNRFSESAVRLAYKRRNEANT